MTLIFPVTWCCGHGKCELKMLDEDGWLVIIMWVIPKCYENCEYDDVRIHTLYNVIIPYATQILFNVSLHLPLHASLFL